MDHFDAKLVSKLFYRNPTNPDLIGSRESSTLEFKESFNFSNIDQYAKVMASFANKDGGYIIFGIKDAPREIVGVDRKLFDSIDPAKLSEGLNSIFHPAIDWDLTPYDWEGLSFGLIYTFSAENKPVIASKNQGEIKDGEIYYRYRGCSEKIKSLELHFLLEKQIEKRNEAWRRVFEKAAQIDPTNVALMDTLSGEITGKGGTVIIDESLVPKLKFIREGDFSEKKGAVTLKLVGDLQAVPVAAVKKQKVFIGNDIYQFRPTHIVNEVRKTLKGKSFSISMHTKAWNKYQPRPAKKTPGYKSEYAEFKLAENDYRYSQAWIDLLITKLKNNSEYKDLLRFKL